ncbi:DUF4123 domain-containing protein [Burkholderia glumae]|uniref:DUF4123 domain-containing protein n=1 Tax=Burkholderia glumae TaxID=337 RepID=UPI0020371C14|nr:DUF4123 domain-containing protein [Burkholderia glumae]MCM2552720.1 DUF4123 domain-containing protein [Burkholderia glumae]
MDSTAIQAFFDTRRQQLSTTVRLYALVDGLLYADQAGVPQRSQASVALFDQTPDASLADAGPWLFDYELASGATRAGLASLAAGAGGVSWLISAYRVDALADELRRRLDARLPDGRTALLRFYDARIMPDIAATMELSQRMQFFVVVFDWLVERDGRLTGVHPHA